jgi:hypothetical protein
MLPIPEEMNYQFEAGEIVAPVSVLFQKFVYELINQAVKEKDEFTHIMNREYLRKVTSGNDLYKKTPKKFRQEVEVLLSLPFEELYEAITGEPLNVNTNVDTKPKLKLVK